MDNRNKPDGHTAAWSKWSPQEDQRLIALIKDGKSIDEIAKEHSRTEGGIRSRQRRIAVRMIEEGKCMEEVCNTLHMTVEEVCDAIDRRKMQTKTTQKDTKTESELDVLKDIREILLRIEASLVKPNEGHSDVDVR